MDYEILIKKAMEAAKNAYAPYSDFPVGACLITDKGNIYTGCNFENVSFGLTICAERNAIGNAINNGERKIKAIAIYSPRLEDCSPCGACRQVLSEFECDEGTDIITGSVDKQIIHKLTELFPKGFKM